ncbi:hypothetical protein AMTR_s00032p00145990 [Amborella trichopoda]|uniref:Uncharacterized protein n=1 Tax=Amborella trichopoda TaxID=13333 RepID=U5CXH8_AMBTC|nr:hypothetical protein AMTR_s00032p00145990 [Amborella trichopoda]
MEPLPSGLQRPASANPSLSSSPYHPRSTVYTNPRFPTPPPPLATVMTTQECDQGSVAGNHEDQPLAHQPKKGKKNPKKKHQNWCLQWRRVPNGAGADLSASRLPLETTQPVPSAFPSLSLCPKTQR